MIIITINELTEIISLFIRTDRMHKTCIDNMIEGMGIHRSQHFLLMFLERYEKIPTQKEIAKELKISPAAVAGTIKKLENDGYIKKESPLLDGRFNHIMLTEKGRAVVEKSKNIFSCVDSVMFDGISDGNTEIFRSCLEKMMSNLENFEGGNEENEKMV